MKNFDGSNVTCNETGKICYSKREAGEIINSKKHHLNNDLRGGAKKFPRRKYFCRICGYFHLTSMKAEYSEVTKYGFWDENYYNTRFMKKNRKAA